MEIRTASKCRERKGKDKKRFKNKKKAPKP